MASPTYEAVVFISEGSDFTLLAGAECLRAAQNLRPVTIVQPAADRLTMNFSGWHLQLAMNEEPHVLEESKEMAEVFPGTPHTKVIAACRRRLEVWSNEPDPNLDHLNDYILTVEALLSRFQGVYGLDQAGGEWFDS